MQPPPPPVQNHLRHPEGGLVPINGHSPFPLPSAPAPAPRNLLSVSVELPVPDISHKWNLTLCGLLCLPSFTEQHVFYSFLFLTFYLGRISNLEGNCKNHTRNPEHALCPEDSGFISCPHSEGSSYRITNCIWLAGTPSPGFSLTFTTLTPLETAGLLFPTTSLHLGLTGVSSGLA